LIFPHKIVGSACAVMSAQLVAPRPLLASQLVCEIVPGLPPRRVHARPDAIDGAWLARLGRCVVAVGHSIEDALCALSLACSACAPLIEAMRKYRRYGQGKPAQA
jgi:hypothetical protein